MSRYVHKSHNVTVLLYRLVFPAKYRRGGIDGLVGQGLRGGCLGLETPHQLQSLEIGTDRDHVHFLVQSVPTCSVTKLVTIIKSLTAREVFRRCPGVKKSFGVGSSGATAISPAPSAGWATSAPLAPMSSSRALATSSCTRTVSWRCSEYPPLAAGGLFFTPPPDPTRKSGNPAAS